MTKSIIMQDEIFSFSYLRDRLIYELESLSVFPYSMMQKNQQSWKLFYDALTQMWIQYVLGIVQSEMGGLEPYPLIQ